MVVFNVLRAARIVWPQLTASKHREGSFLAVNACNKDYILTKPLHTLTTENNQAQGGI